MEEKSSPPKEPEKVESTETDPDKKAKDQEVKDKIWEKKVEMWIADEQIFKENMRKAYALIFDSYCGKEMQ